MSGNRKEALERRKKTISSHDILGDLAGTIDKAQEEKKVSVGVIAERRVERRIMKSSNENKKTIRLHPDLRHTLEKHAQDELRPFTDVLREVIMAGLKAKGIEISKQPDMNRQEQSSPDNDWQ